MRQKWSRWWVFFDQGVSSLINLLCGFLVSRHFDPEIFGVYTMAVGLSFLASACVSAVIYNVVAIDSVRIRAAKGAYIAFAERISFFLSILAGGLLFVFLRITFDNIYGIDVICIFAFLSCVFDSTRRFGYISGSSRQFFLTLFRLSILLILPMMFSGFDFASNALFYVISLQLLVGVLFVSLRVFVSRGRFYSAGMIGRIFGRGWPLLLSILLVSGFEQGTLLGSSFFLGAEFAGGWRASSYLFGLFAPVLLTSDAILAPALRKRFGPRFQFGISTLAVVVGCAVAISAATSFVSSAFYLPLLGAEYVQFSWMSWAYVLVFSATLIKTVLSFPIRAADPRRLLIGNALGIAVATIWLAFTRMDSEAAIVTGICLFHLVAVASLFVFFIFARYQIFWRNEKAGRGQDL